LTFRARVLAVPLPKKNICCSYASPRKVPERACAPRRKRETCDGDRHAWVNVARGAARNVSWHPEGGSCVSAPFRSSATATEN